MILSVVGLGYVGLTTAVCFAQKGIQVLGVEKDRSKLDKIRSGEPSFHEEGLAKLLEDNLGQSFHIGDDVHNAVKNSQITLVCVGTPTVNGKIDLSGVLGALKEIVAEVCASKKFHVIVIKSTVVPGSTDSVFREFIEQEFNLTVGQDIGLCVNPEFLREGSAVQDFMEPDRIVIGSSDKKSENELIEVYEVFKPTPLLFVSNTTAELIKYTSNSFFATLISFSNEISNIAEHLPGTEINTVLEGLFLDRRITKSKEGGNFERPDLISYIRPGIGFGGSCFPKDIRALASCAEGVGVTPKLLKSVLEVNEYQPQNILSLGEKAYGQFKNKSVGVLGLSFKSNSDDIRESKSIDLIKFLLLKSANVFAYDPMAMPNTKELMQDYDIHYLDTLTDVVSMCETVFVCVDWQEFHQLSELVESIKPNLNIVDAKLFLDRSKFKNYIAVGDSHFL